MSTRAGSRDIALAVVRDVFGQQQRRAQAAFDYRVRRSDLAPRDRAFAAELAYGAIKMRRALDWYLRPYLAGRTHPLPAPIAEALRLGVYQLRFMHGVDEHAAVFETVGAALRVGHRGTAGLVNAVLRRFIADALPPPKREDFETEDEYLGTRFSVPNWIVAQWRERFGERVTQILAGVNGPPQLGIRVNELRTDRWDVVSDLSERGVAVHASSLVEESLVVDERPQQALEDHPEGRWSLQGEASCVPVDILEPKRGETVADFCSGRGNKAAQAGARMANAGTLVCIEIDERRARVLRERLDASGVSIARVVCADAREAEPDLAADAVLLDAPCTGVGILGRHPEARWRKRPDDALQHAVMQGTLLRAAAARTKAGGRIVYSVCSTDRRECEDIVDAFLEESEGFARGEPSLRYIEFVTPSGDVLIPPGIAGRDGFYVALLRRGAAA